MNRSIRMPIERSQLHNGQIVGRPPLRQTSDFQAKYKIQLTSELERQRHSIRGLLNNKGGAQWKRSLARRDMAMFHVEHAGVLPETGDPVIDRGDNFLRGNRFEESQQCRLVCHVEF